jgi:hypothetical protein
MLWVLPLKTRTSICCCTVRRTHEKVREGRGRIICSAECCFVARSLLGAFSKAKKRSLLAAIALPRDSYCTEVFRVLVKAIRNVFIINRYVCSAAYPAFCRGKLYHDDILQEKKCLCDYVDFKRQK